MLNLAANIWALKKEVVAEMRMLRWMYGVTKLDRIRYERITGSTKVGEIYTRKCSNVG